ncbi:GNAT family N-acetyltransferase [Sphingobacterium sp. DK4209]|uniref:GNAT family N-acetyltransferase n=1 Tax=Sphingobacterium zhuxiongii TaxID=2662364 RepID=A0A5Q0Q9I2_9SPHI|nr:MULTISPECIES: GNAT family N-acetyltransferase [unclassified Sphingobacterium]MVZ64451.1 GNAT family N-acetyltransferase [Sphingobacterium sp. DK4209]QGA25789.1 GNAT family N-acetyltransferase [Sphingobacterium sp. dk4302]
MKELNIRPYQVDDYELVLRLFNTNVPSYFAEEERNDLIEYLNNEREEYFVIEQDTHLVGAGGINYKGNDAYISWDFVDASLQGLGIGKQLLSHRLEIIKSNKTVERIIVRTSQFAFKFYEKNGFVAIETHKDYWAPGIDMIYMTYKDKKVNNGH